MTEPTHEDYTKVLRIMARMATANREVVGHLRIMTAILDEQQGLLEAAQTQMDDLKMRIAGLEAARSKGH